MKKIYYFLLGAILLTGSIFTYIIIKDNKTKNNIEDNPEVEKEEEIKKLTILEPDSKTRPYAVMINNHPEARKVQAGLQDAYIIYEMNVEGGITRMLALYKDKETTRIGSVRSARHTYLDYVLENDAIYIHFGWSYLAEEQIPKLGVNNVNGLNDSGFFRDNTLNVAYEHTAFTSMANIKSAVQAKGYRLTSDKKLLLNYSIEEVDSSIHNNKVNAHTVNLNFSLSTINNFIYDDTNKVYKKQVNGVDSNDYNTKKQFTVKNIIAIKVRNWTMTGTTLQDFSNVGSGEGYFITNGIAVPIKWNKSTRSSQTSYTYLNGEEITVNDGNTYIAIVPLGNTIELK